MPTAPGGSCQTSKVRFALNDPFLDEFDLPVRIGGQLLEDFDHELTRMELRRYLFCYEDVDQDRSAGLRGRRLTRG